MSTKEEDKGQAKTYNDRGVALKKMGRNQDMINEYTIVILFNTYDAFACHNRGALQKRWEERKKKEGRRKKGRKEERKKGRKEERKKQQMVFKSYLIPKILGIILIEGIYLIIWKEMKKLIKITQRPQKLILKTPQLMYKYGSFYQKTVKIKRLKNIFHRA